MTLWALCDAMKLCHSYFVLTEHLICNGVQQGAILSGILYCFYVNGMFEDLRISLSVLTLVSLATVMIPFYLLYYAMKHNLHFSTDPNP